MPKKILVVDDEPDILKVMLYRLRKLGCDIASCTTGQEALDSVSAVKPDVIVLDYRLPDIDGIEIVRRIRRHDTLGKTPIVLISASSGGDISAAAREAGVNEYIVKPFEPEALLAAVRKYL